LQDKKIFLDSLAKVSESPLIMGRGRKRKTQKMKNRKHQSAKKLREKKQRDSVRKSRIA
jgi:hypothetical protein